MRVYDNKDHSKDGLDVKDPEIQMLIRRLIKAQKALNAKKDEDCKFLNKFPTELSD